MSAMEVEDIEDVPAEQGGEKAAEASQDSAPKTDLKPDEETQETRSDPPKSQEEGNDKWTAPLPELTELKKDQDEDSFDANPQVTLDDMKAAQEELNQLDILVCGGCHYVFHFMEDFHRHKGHCRRKSNFSANVMERKPQVWAFLLWKNANVKVTRRGIPMEESSWKLYQKWCKMPERIRSAWVAAGETVMNFSTFSFSRSSDTQKKKIERMDTTDIAGYKEDIEIIRNQLEDESFLEKEEPKRSSDLKTSDESKVGVTKLRRAKDVEEAAPGQVQEEYVVEKIVSRRFNPRKKQYEYLIKWEGYPSEQNTWEPAENMETCQHLLKIFEENLAKNSTKVMNKVQQKKVSISSQPESPQLGPVVVNAQGRPVRTSKQKAFSQVKAWCGSIKPDEMDDDSEEENSVKRIKLEDDLKRGKPGVRTTPLGRPPGRLLSNGTKTSDNLAVELGLESSGDEGETSKTKGTALAMLNNKSLPVKSGSSMSPTAQQVLVANAKGVVKVDPSQVPNLTSGVYIMSNQSGIIKLDSVSPAKAMSVKQQIPLSQPPSGSVVIKTAREAGVQKSGIIRKNPGILKGGIPQVARNTPRPIVRPAGNLRLDSPRPTAPLKTPATPSRPRLPLVKENTVKPIMTPQRMEEKKVLGPKRPAASRGHLGQVPRGRLGGMPIKSEPGKVLAKAEGERTPDPTPPPSPAKEVISRELELVRSVTENIPTTSSFLNSLNKDMMMKKTLKPGTIGSVTVSPKKVEAPPPEPEPESKEDDMVTLTGDDGTVYKVSNSELTNSLLVSGEDGQQCVYVTADSEEGTTVLTLDPSYADTVAQLGQVNMIADSDGSTQFFVKEEEGELVGLQVEGDGGDPTQVVAQLVEAAEPETPGGPRRVVLLLPDGNLMVTEVDDEQFRALDLDK